MCQGRLHVQCVYMLLLLAWQCKSVAGVCKAASTHGRSKALCSNDDSQLCLVHLALRMDMLKEQNRTPLLSYLCA
jgi:hypothetical protein